MGDDRDRLLFFVFAAAIPINQQSPLYPKAGFAKSAAVAQAAALGLLGGGGRFNCRLR